MNQLSVNSFEIKFQPWCREQFSLHQEPVVILVTPEYEGIFKNGGIGTYYRTLSEKLATMGEKVHLILLLCQSKTRFQGKSTVPYVDRIFSVHEVEECLELLPVHVGILAQFQPWQWVESESYKILFFVQALAASCPEVLLYIEFPDLCGLGYRTIQAKRAGLLGQQCITAVTLHSGQEWLNEAHENYILGDRWNWFRTVYTYEQYSFENADRAFFLSFFMAEKVSSYGWKTAHALHLPYCFSLVPPLNPHRPLLKKLGLNLKREHIPLIFFGRLEKRKGLLTFVEAIKILEPSLRSSIHILFLGKIVPLEAQSSHSLDSQQYIEQHLGDHWDYTLLSDLFSQEAIALVQELAPAIVCLTSPQENFPNSALEMGQLPVSLIVSDTGGFREPLNLIDRSDGIRWFNPGNSSSLASQITHAIAAYPERPSPPSQKFLADINQSLFNHKLEYIKQARFPPNQRSPRSDAFLLGMTSAQEQIFLREYGEHQYSGQGEMVDVGCWLGSATISLAQGLEKNRQVALKFNRIHAYDLFVWHPYMEASVKETEIEGKYQQEDNFMDEFMHRIDPWNSLIAVYPGDVMKIGWQPQKPIEYLFVDAMKSWGLTKSIVRDFYPHLIPHKSLVHYNDFAHYYESWIHVLIYKLRPYFNHYKNLYQAAVFEYVNPLPQASAMWDFDPPFHIFSDEEIHQAFEYSMEIVHKPLRANIAAAKVMAFIHLGNYEKAQQELEQARKTFGEVLDIPTVAQLLQRKRSNG
ncbi:glycosyltransferase family 4 protein [Roseofilum sp. BLCC_M154]|uniref:Glycosyltransferase family 4 protein n=1 Tax=Roseofilum acuticapitatum BLCC-M154 TaxID=3022444 RepID=A0ABT7AUI4_9CYAN|nr:glycosyltransferase family 4 protein [Roseofilum acuticapitatum]MDJ1170565.1 glycosyltransferase family 4 protein [Roseofilum acuticapitatum BLCC-M154]